MFKHKLVDPDNVTLHFLSFYRCLGAGLCFQHGAAFHSKVRKQFVGENAVPVLEPHIDKKRAMDRVRQASTQYKEARWKVKAA